MKTKEIVICGIITALLCVFGPIGIPVAGIPITLTTLIIYIAAFVFDPRISLTSVAIYIVLGCFGLPVFSGFAGGITHLIGPSGGFVVGYIPLVISVSLLKNSNPKSLIGIIIGTALLYLFGLIGYKMYTDQSVTTLLSVCVLPFLPGDIVKIILSLIISPKFKRIMCKK